MSRNPSRTELSWRRITWLTLLAGTAMLAVTAVVVAESGSPTFKIFVNGQPQHQAGPLTIQPPPFQLRQFTLPAPDSYLENVPMICLAGSDSPACARARQLAMATPCTRPEDCQAYDLWRGWIGEPQLELAESAPELADADRVESPAASQILESFTEASTFDLCALQAAEAEQPDEANARLISFIEARKIDCNTQP